MVQRRIRIAGSFPVWIISPFRPCCHFMSFRSMPFPSGSSIHLPHLSSFIVFHRLSSSFIVFHRLDVQVLKWLVEGESLRWSTFVAVPLVAASSPSSINSLMNLMFVSQKPLTDLRCNFAILSTWLFNSGDRVC